MDLNFKWIDTALEKGMDLFLLFFDDLINDLGRALVKLAYFLGVTLSPEELQCILNNSEGHFHRGKRSADLFKNVTVQITHLRGDKKILQQKVGDCVRKSRCIISGCGFLYI